MKRIMILLAALALSGCASFVTPQTFSQRVAYVEATAEMLGRTCLDLSKRDRIPVNTLIRCAAKVEQAGDLVDAARLVGSGAGEDRLLVAQRMLIELENELRKRESQ